MKILMEVQSELVGDTPYGDVVSQWMVSIRMTPCTEDNKVQGGIRGFEARVELDNRGGMHVHGPEADKVMVEAAIMGGYNVQLKNGTNNFPPQPPRLCAMDGCFHEVPEDGPIYDSPHSHYLKVPKFCSKRCFDGWTEWCVWQKLLGDGRFTEAPLYGNGLKREYFQPEDAL